VASEKARLAVVGERIDEILAQVPDPCSPLELAVAVGLTERSIRRFCATGELPAVMVGRRWQITHAGIRVWVIDQTVNGLAV